MYNYLRGYVKVNRAWIEKDISAESIETILSSYEDAKIISTWDSGAEEFQIPLNTNRNIFNNAVQTLPLITYLSTFTTEDLATAKTITGLIDARAVNMKDLYDFNITSTCGNINYGEGQEVPIGMEWDLKFKTDFDDADEASTVNINKNMLVAINGLIHQTYLRDGWIYVQYAMRQMLTDNSNVASVINFTDVGGLEKYDITEDNIRVVTRSSEDVSRMITRVVVTTPEPINDKTALLVINGYLHILDSSYKEISANEIVIEIDHRTAFDRIARKSREPMDYVNAANVRGNGVDVSEFDAIEYLTKSVSFVAAVKTTDLSILKEKVGHTKIKNQYTHYRAPLGLMVYETNELAPYYISDYNEKEVALNVFDNTRKNLNLHTAGLTTQGGLGKTYLSSAEYDLMSAWTIDLYTLS